MAIKTISQFDAATPTSNDKILFEQNGEGKSTALADLPIPTKTQTALDKKVNISDVLSIDDIYASTDLTGKVASASALKRVNNRLIIVSLVCRNGIFPIDGNPPPYKHVQVCCVARNISNGSFYALWYNYGTKAFEVGVVLSGSSPSEGQSVVVQYASGYVNYD